MPFFRTCEKRLSTAMRKQLPVKLSVLTIGIYKVSVPKCPRVPYQSARGFRTKVPVDNSLYPLDLPPIRTKVPVDNLSYFMALP